MNFAFAKVDEELKVKPYEEDDTQGWTGGPGMYQVTLKQAALSIFEPLTNIDIQAHNGLEKTQSKAQNNVEYWWMDARFEGFQ